MPSLSVTGETGVDTTEPVAYQAFGVVPASALPY